MVLGVWCSQNAPRWQQGVGFSFFVCLFSPSSFPSRFVCVCVCVRACVRACVCVCVFLGFFPFLVGGGGGCFALCGHSAGH